MKRFHELFIPVSYLEEGDIVSFPVVYIEMKESKNVLLYHKSNGEACISAVLLYKRKIIQYQKEPIYILFFGYPDGIKRFYMEGNCEIKLCSFYSRKTLPMPISLLECGDVVCIHDELFLFVNIVDANYTTVNIVELTDEILKNRNDIIANQTLFYHPHHLYFATSGYLELDCAYLSPDETASFPPISRDEIIYNTIRKELQELIIDNGTTKIQHCVFPVLYGEPCNHVTVFLCAEKAICERCFRTTTALCLYPIPDVINLYKEKLKE